MLHIAGAARFISDLHLNAARADIAARFFAFLADTAKAKVSALFILGDLFDAWIGDDDLTDPFNTQVCTRLRQLADSGTQVFFMAGNRDFLIGDSFAAASGVHRLDEPQKVGAGLNPFLDDTAILLLHGDTLCTDDVDYQRFRQLVRSGAWQADFLARPLAERRAEAQALRQRSRLATQAKAEDIMDVNAGSVRAALAAAACHLLIHGHTHRPGCERITLADGIAERWVLSDWDTGRGDALEVNADGIRRIDLSS